MKNLLLVLSILVIMSCDRSNPGNHSNDFALLDRMEEVDTESFEMMEAPSTSQTPPQSPEINQKLIKTGRIGFESDDVQKDYKAIVKKLTDYKAYVENENQTRSTYRINYDMTVRVASENYDVLFIDIVDLAGKVENKSSTIEDVTDRYYDLQTRIKNKQALEKRYIDLLAKANDIKDILAIEKNLNEVRTDIERLQGQFKYLNKQISYSTIYVNFYEQLPYSYQASQRQGFGARILTAINGGWQSFLSFIVGTLRIWPFILLLIGAIYLIRKGRLLWKNRKK